MKEDWVWPGQGVQTRRGRAKERERRAPLHVIKHSSPVLGTRAETDERPPPYVPHIHIHIHILFQTHSHKMHTMPQPATVHLTSDNPIWLNARRGGASLASMTGQKWSPWRYIITAVNASTIPLASPWLLTAIMIDKALHALASLKTQYKHPATTQHTHEHTTVPF